MMMTWIPLAMVVTGGDSIFTAGQQCAAQMNNRNAWFEAAGEVVTLPFRDLADEGLVFVTDQYFEEHGVLFTDFDDFVTIDEHTFPNDSVGVDGFGDTITVRFDPPIHWVAVDQPTCNPLLLFSGARQILKADNCWQDFVGAGSTLPIDRVVIVDGPACVCIDDLHFSRTPITIDCNLNGIPDLIEIRPGCSISPDCNGNLVPDDCDLDSGLSEDCDENGVLDECEIAQLYGAYDEFSPFGAPSATTIRFFDLPAAASDVALTVSVSADLDESFEFIVHVAVDDEIIGEFFFVDDGLLCADPPQQIHLSVPADQFNAAFEDNDRLDVDVKPTITVDPDECHPSFVGVELAYLTFAEADLNYNGVPDACEGPPGDVDADGDVDLTDLLSLLATWGDCPPAEYCPADIDLSGSVGLGDLLLLLSNWT